MFRQQQIKNLQDQKLKQNNNKLKDEKKPEDPPPLTAPFPLRELKGNPRIRSNASASSASRPIEAPKGCLRRLLPSNSNFPACNKVSSDRPLAAKASKENNQIKNLQDQKLKQNNNKLKDEKKPKDPPPLTAPFPLRELKGNPRIRSNASASSACRPIEAPKGCLRRLLPSNSNFPACNKVSSDRPLAAKASKENNHFHRTLQKDNRSFICRQESANMKKPTSKPVTRSKLSSNSSVSVKKCSSGERGFRLNSKNLKQVDEKIGLGIPIVLPERLKPASPSNVDQEAVDLDSISGSSSVKTPPVEASVSPEIQFGAARLIASSGTPVCYGAGHILSGVKDNRKCRPRGILIIGKQLDPLGSKDTDILGNCSDKNADESFPKSRPSFVPLPVEASMKWLLSPDGDVDEVQKSSIGASSSSSSLKSCSQVVSGFGSDRDHRENCPDVDDGKSIAKTRFVLLSPQEFPSFQGFSGGSDGNVDVDLSSPFETLGSKDAGCFEILDNFRFSSTVDKSSFSNSSVSCGNVVQTPTSDLSSDKAAGFCWTDADNHDLELDSMADILGKASISTKIQMPDQDYLSLDQQQHHDNNTDECASWVSESTLASMSLSGMRISWREGLGSQIFYTDELDCCRCLSDEENDCGKGDTCHTNALTAHEPVLIEKHKPSRNIGGLRTPQLLNLERGSYAKKGKEKLSQAGPDVSAESICIDGGSLVASGDSDWSQSYKNHLFRV